MDFNWWLNTIIFPVIRAVMLIVVLLTGFAYLTWYERKLLARFQVRLVPTGPAPRGCCSRWPMRSRPCSRKRSFPTMWTSRST